MQQTTKDVKFDFKVSQEISKVLVYDDKTALRLSSAKRSMNV